MGKFLITGGAGFIGSHLVDRLIARGDEVVILDDLSSGQRRNIHKGARLVQGTILDGPLVDRLAAGTDGIFHLAAQVSVQACIDDWMGAHRINLDGALTVFLAAQRNGNLPVVFTSTAAVYGDSPNEFCRETDAALPVSPYGADKLAAELHLRALFATRGLPSVSLRLFNVYGDRQDPRSPYAGVISKFFSDVREGRPHTVYGDGQQVRDFIYVNDVVSGLLDAFAFITTQPGAHCFNLCTGKATSVIDLARRIDAVCAEGLVAIRHVPARKGDIRVSRGAGDAARSAFGFLPAFTVDQGLSDLHRAMGRD
ncbi:NAD-dependent epimerase/dehydratase family protein [Paracoccus sp. WLY502]|uniref:NAD-dependent epimerase/dehydratase family protein n=1 Tax=Paracoccus yibinensis TaxID=3068891 RepID=UPI002796952C|nr:NAD-dependent epimerase/dehydratase family protein [Paracoccus sp. WLY502]MDQ1901123.1 NAD-dependent epimerase/dehydratase family protein [Paracoccus sp. WLY502]